MTPLLQQGLELAGFGMGMVFTFLTLLVMATYLMSHIIQRYFPMLVIAKTAAAVPGKEASDEDLVFATAAAVSAVRRYREDHPHR